MVLLESIATIFFLMVISNPGTLAESSPPIMITQVELWGPTSFYTDGVKLCENDGTSLGPWIVGWVELHNTKNKIITINNVDLRGKGWEEGQLPITLNPNEYCYIPTQGKFSTRVGVGGSLGNGPPIHENSTITLAYSIQTDTGKVNYKSFTSLLNDNFADTRTWQLVDGNWIFKEANITHEFPIKTILLPPLKQFKSGVNVKDLQCKAGLLVIVKKSDNSPACVTSSTSSSLTERNWGVLGQNMPIQNTNFTVFYYTEGGGKLDQIVPDLGTHGLILYLKTTNEGKITLFIPRSFINASEIGDYTGFNVTSDGKKVDFQQYLTPTDRMFVISFKSGMENVRIIPQL